MFVVCGATGKIGKIITEKLLGQGYLVRAIGRSKERLKPLVKMGAEAFVADLSDTKQMTKAFTGAEVVFAMIPPNLKTTDLRKFQNDIGNSIATAIRKSGVKNVVNLSSIGANLSTGVGVINGLHDQEVRLNQLANVNIFHIRPTFFMENHLLQIDSIKKNDMMFTPQNLNMPSAQIAIKDIADYAIERITKLDFEGHVTRELLGPADLSMNQIATAIGHAIGNDHLQYQKSTYADSRKHMLKLGISENVADNMIELYHAFNNGICHATEKRTAENTTATTIDSFSKTFAQIYNHK
jgi:uncharacterized protein YbjT (DUF2867 family)